MQFASKCAVFQILLDKSHLYFCVSFPLNTGKDFSTTALYHGLNTDFEISVSVVALIHS